MIGAQAWGQLLAQRDKTKVGIASSIFSKMRGGLLDSSTDRQVHQKDSMEKSWEVAWTWSAEHATLAPIFPINTDKMHTKTPDMPFLNSV